MPKPQTYKDLLAAVNSETTRIGDALIHGLTQLESGDLTEDEEQDVLIDFRTHADRLRELCRDPADPIPAD